MPACIPVPLMANAVETVSLESESTVDVLLLHSPRFDLFLLAEPIIHFVMEG